MKNYTKIILSIGLLFFMALSINAQGVIPGSVITDDLNDDNTILTDWLDDNGQVPSGTLLYRRSTHGASAAAFHNLVDNQGPTLVIFKASNGQVFGGYAPNSWSSTSTGWKSSTEAFLFNLNSNRKATPYYPQYSTYNQAYYGPTFGGGHDINISNDMNSGYFNVYGYNSIDGSGYRSSTSLNALTGLNTTSTYYSFGSGFITEIEVYLIEFDVSAPIVQGQDFAVTLDSSGNASITAQDIDTGSYDADGPVTLSIDRDTFTCDDVGAGGIPVDPTNIGTNNINNRSIGAAFNPNTEEFWIPQWAGTTVYKTSQDGTQQLGTFDSGQQQMMQMWMDTDSATDYYTANWGYNTITKRSGSSTVWSYNMGGYAAGVSTDADYVYAIGYYSGNSISVLNKQTGQLVYTINLNAYIYVNGSLAVVNDIIYIGGVGNYGTSNNGSWNYIHRFDMQGQYLGSTYSSYPTYYGWSFDGENLWVGSYNNMLGFKISDGNAYGAGASAVTLTVTDPLGNTKSEDFRVTVIDDIIPEITCPGTITVNATNTCSAEVTYNATATDNCNTEITYSIASGSSFNVGTTSVTATAKDPGGNEVSCTFDVIVVDSEAPVISCLDNITIDHEPDNCGATVSFGTAGTGNIFTVGAHDMQLREIDDTDYSIISQKTIVPSSGSYRTTHGMAKDPSNGDVYVILGDYNNINRVLAMLDLTTGNATIVGNTGRFFSSIAFSDNGTLYGVTGNADSPQGGLYTMDKTDASNILLRTIHSGRGQALAFNPDDGYLYHWSDPIMEKIDLSTLTVTNIPITGYTSASSSCNAWINGVTYNSNGNFIVSGRCGSANINITTDGLATLTNNSLSLSSGILIDGNNFGITATDNCSYTITQTAGLESGSVFPVGTTVNTFVATDPAGNSTSCSFNVTVLGSEINVSGNEETIEDEDTTPDLADHTDFGQPLPGVPVVRTFTIENNGSAPLTVSSLTVGGTEASSFTMGGITLPSEIAAAETTIFTITFVATPIADYNATVSITSDACNVEQYDFAIHAEVTCLPVAFTECPTNKEVSNTLNQCGAEVTYTTTLIGDPAPDVSYTFTGATSGSGEGTGSGLFFNVGVTQVSINATNPCGDETCTFDVTVTDDEAPAITCPTPDASYSADSGLCSASLTFDATSTDNCEVASTVYSVDGVTISFPNAFAVGTTTVDVLVTDIHDNPSNCAFDVVVTDDEAPVIACVTGENRDTDAGLCTYTIQGTEFDATFTDNCSDGSITNNINGTATIANEDFGKGATTITWTVDDGNGQTATCTTTITVEDNEDPVFNFPQPQDQLNIANDSGECGAIINWLEPTATDNCDASVTIERTDLTGLNNGDLFPVGLTTISYSATDTSNNVTNHSFNVTVNNTHLPTNTSGVIAGLDPIQAGTGFDLSANFNDDNLTSVTWYFSSDGNFTNGDTAEITDYTGTISGGDVSGTFNFDYVETGVYTVKVVVEDACGETAEATYDFIVIYDPSGGFVTGGGWIYSPMGALAGSDAVGKANFGLVSKYKTGKNNVLELGGNTNFQFKEGGFHFKSSEYDELSLVISGDKKATYRGVGSVNRSGSHKFLVTVIDGDAAGGDGNDKFRIKIWGDNSSSNDDVVYDNEFNIPENADSSTIIGGGSIVIHKPFKFNGSSAIVKEELFEGLELVTWPNPSNDYFNLKLKSGNTLDKINIHVFDLKGRLISFKTGEPNRDYKIGETLQSGLYFINVVQGSESKQVKLIKH